MDLSSIRQHRVHGQCDPAVVAVGIYRRRALRRLAVIPCRKSAGVRGEFAQSVPKAEGPPAALCRARPTAPLLPTPLRDLQPILYVLSTPMGWKLVKATKIHVAAATCDSAPQVPAPHLVDSPAIIIGAPDLKRLAAKATLLREPPIAAPSTTTAGRRVQGTRAVDEALSGKA